LNNALKICSGATLAPFKVNSLSPRVRLQQRPHALIPPPLPPPFMAGTVESTRGAGVHFGADVTKDFLQRNGLTMLIRSHEVKDKGLRPSILLPPYFLVLTPSLGGCRLRGDPRLLTNHSVLGLALLWKEEQLRSLCGVCRQE